MSSALTAFLSHKSEDAELAQQLCDAMEKSGVRCWIAPRDIPPGHSWAEGIVEGIDGCVAFVLLATTRSVLSREVLIELERAHRLARPIYTVMVDKPRLAGEITYYLSRLQWLETKSGGIDQAASRLAEVLHGTKRWDVVATPPSLGRRIRSTMPSFVGTLTAVLVGFLLFGAAAWYTLHHVQKTIATDYHSLGWTTLDTIPVQKGSGALVVGHVWLGDGNEQFSRVGLHILLSLGATERLIDLSSHLPQEGTREGEFSFTLPPDVSAFATFLSVPKGSQLFCVTQRFSASSGQVIRAGDPIISTVRDVSMCSR
jgi:hypothetical protein